MHKLSLRLILVLIGLLLSFGFLELSIRIWKRDIAFQPDPNLIRSLRPNVRRKIYSYDGPDVLRSLPKKIPDRPEYLGMVYTNNVGLRMKEDIGPKTPGERRILFLGDSNTEAIEVPDEQRFYHLLQRSLDRSMSPSIKTRWRVINGAIQNGTPSQYILQLRRYMEKFKPDVILAFIAPNDVMDDFNFENREGFIFDSRGIPVKPKRQFRLWLIQKSWFVRYLMVATRKWLPQVYKIFWPPNIRGYKQPDWGNMLCNSDKYHRDWFNNKTGKYLVELNNMAKNQKAKFGVFLIYYMYVFDGEPYYEPRHPRLKEKLAKLGCSENSGRSYGEFMESFLKDKGIPYWNSFDTFLREKKKNPNKKLWHYVDYHFSPAGHRLIAKDIFRFLQNMAPIR